MRLDRIKLSGFKSFVDPTTIPTPGNLIGIVGPNGCGKSNIIDAVRWVMGESSAKHLRGENMADVIFNGSSSRKPVSLASVELVFDNSEGKAPGEYAQFQEISIKRQVSRDGQSTYILNGTRCRRKDITDLFLGTGLGSRSYAIIEQGTISRLIEAKPAELRELIEEAAGISKYKERRHETELRMGHTQENLARLQDLREEIGKQLESLKRQARKAEKYTALKAEELITREQLLGLKWRKHLEEFQGLQARLTEIETDFRAQSELDCTLSETLHTLREDQESLQKKLNLEQADFYEVSSEIGQLTQNLRHARETQENLIQERERLLEEKQSIASNLDDDNKRLEALREEFETLSGEIDEAASGEGLLASIRNEADTRLKEARQELTRIEAERSKFASQESIETSRIRQIEIQLDQLRQRVDRLKHEKNTLETSLDTQALSDFEEDHARLDAERNQALHEQTDLQQKIATLRENAQQSLQRLNQDRTALNTLKGRIASFETLQEHAMGKDREALHAWLLDRGLEECARLGEVIEVESGWETAVEIALGDYLEALCVEHLSEIAPAIENLKGESLTLIQSGLDRANRTLKPLEAPRLSDKIKGPIDLFPLLGHTVCAPSLTHAIALADRLEDPVSVITPEGVRIGKGWLCAEKSEDGHAGLIKRERELKDMKAERDQLELGIIALEDQREVIERDQRDAEHRREDTQQKERQINQELARIRAELSTARALHEQSTKRLNNINHELEDTKATFEEQLELLENARMLKEEASQQVLSLAEILAGRNENLEQEEMTLSRSDRDLFEAKSRHGQLKSRLENVKASEQLTTQHLDRSRKQLASIEDRLQALDLKTSKTLQPSNDSEERLEILQAKKTSLESTLGVLRGQLEELEGTLKISNESKLKNDQRLAKTREQAERIKLDLSANEVRRQTVLEQFEETGSDPEQVATNLPLEASEKVWQDRANELSNEITRLGAVNLAAMEELETQEERMAFLEQQNLDLTESLKTLQEAIEKIDRECRTRFKETFDLINAGLQRMFPKLFGGGQASLELTEKDLLETGVTVIARPPGKRNSSIHLLSGGEKALTAAALVFAIFELNPAPFCLLDEVDAPLDDANVGRFSQLVKEMSERVQFLFISHNKVTMEIAQHLAGVTMKEPGVSRIVAVDIDAAVDMATA